MTHHLEHLVPAGMPIEAARQVLERNGYVCTYQEYEGVEYLQCVQMRTKRLGSDLAGVWSANVYHQNGLVRNLQSRYDATPVERGVRVRPRAPRRISPALFKKLPPAPTSLGSAAPGIINPAASSDCDTAANEG